MNDKVIHAIITDRGRYWKQLRYQINIEGDDEYEESGDSLRIALGECEKLEADKVTLFRDSYFTKTTVSKKFHIGQFYGTKEEFFALDEGSQLIYKEQYNKDKNK